MLRPTSLGGATFRAIVLTTLLALAAGSGARAAGSPVPFGRPPAATPLAKFLRSGALHPTASRMVAGAAAALPLDAPWGLTVAPNGDLYVANLLGNQVVVYGTNLAQKTSGTISAGLSHPTGVAFDSMGEVYVSNNGSNSISVYSANHTYLPNRTIVASVNGPVAIAIDGFDDLYVDQNYTAVGLFDASGAFAGNLPTSALTGPINSFAQHTRLTVFAGSNQVLLTPTLADIENVKAGGLAGGNGLPRNDALAVAFDARSNLYIGTGDPAVFVFNPFSGVLSELAALSFIPAAIAVDTSHNHVFVSDPYNNAIAVYSLGGQFVATLH